MSRKKYYNDFTYFLLGDAYHYGVSVAEILDEKYRTGELVGRSCNIPHDYGVLAQAVVNAGDGDHIETGTLWGSSAIVAALAKKKFKMNGVVYCIDPLDGYYGKGKPDHINTGAETPCEELVQRNFKVMGVAPTLIREKSVPFPKSLKWHEFTSGFIDGDHWNDGPQKDWKNISKATSGYIVFDNYDTQHPAVVKAVQDANWQLVHLSSIVAVFMKEGDHNGVSK